MKPRADIGNGEPCPKGHGRMYVLASGREWCAHTDCQPTPRPAPDSSPARTPAPEAENELRFAWGDR